MVAGAVVDFNFTDDHDSILRLQRFQDLLSNGFICYRIRSGAVHLALVVIVHLQALHDQSIFAAIQTCQQHKAGREFGKRGQCTGVETPDVVEVSFSIRYACSNMIVADLDDTKSVRSVERDHTVKDQVQQAKMKRRRFGSRYSSVQIDHSNPPTVPKITLFVFFGSPKTLRILRRVA